VEGIDPAPADDMTTDLDSLTANLSAPDRDRLKGAFAAIVSRSSSGSSISAIHARPRAPDSR
jgi:hypothetical protein